jgi:hypothetical protein
MKLNCPTEAPQNYAVMGEPKQAKRTLHNEVEELRESLLSIKAQVYSAGEALFGSNPTVCENDEEYGYTIGDHILACRAEAGQIRKELDYIIDRLR